MTVVTRSKSKQMAGGDGDQTGERYRLAAKGISKPHWIIDTLLTIGFGGLVISFIFGLVQNNQYDELYLYVLLTFVAAAVFASVRFVFEKFGRWLSSGWLKGEPFNNPLAVPLEMKKWRDQSWQLFIHFTMAIVDYYMTSDLNLLEGYPESFFTPVAKQQEHSWLLKFGYLCQAGIWTYTAFSFRFIEEVRKDYLVMFIHHNVTLGLVMSSWTFNYHRIGAMVLFVHDISDIFIDTMKMVNYLKVEGPQAFFITEIAYFSAIVTWAYYRLYLFPIKIISSGYYSVDVTYIQLDHSDPAVRKSYELWWHPTEGLVPFYVLCVGFLTILFILHIYWFILLLNIGYKVITKGAHKAGEEEYEGMDESTRCECLCGGVDLGCVMRKPCVCVCDGSCDFAKFGHKKRL